MSAGRNRKTALIQSLDRGLAILQAVGRSKQPLSLNEVGHLLGVSRSGVGQLTYTLKRRGFLSNPIGGKDVLLGPSMWRLISRYDWGAMLTRVASQQLRFLASHTNETAQLAVRQGQNALFLDSASGNHLIAVSGQIGRLVPLYCTAHGKSLIMDMTGAQLSSILGSDPLPKHTAHTLTSIQRLSKDLRLINAQGFAMDRGEYYDEMSGMAAPIRVDSDAIVGSIGISVPCSRVTTERWLSYSEQVCKVAREIGLMLNAVQQTISHEALSLQSDLVLTMLPGTPGTLD
jgi:DNA-binding IclR family transcriptional regulator